jgi:anaerobic selenocysteine-containing dehydrogenase
MQECEIEHGDVVDVISLIPSREPLRLDGVTAIVYDIARGCVGAYYPEANCLLPLDHQDTQSGTPAYKSIPVRVCAAA